MDIKEAIELYLPKYLSPTAKVELKKLISEFPDNIDSRFYTNYLRNELTIYQGDGIREMSIIDFPDSKVYKTNSIIFSNTCDISSENDKLYPSRLTYSPIIELSKYINLLLESNIDKERVQNHKLAIKNQEVTQIMYLPPFENLNESIVFLDRINNCNVNSIQISKLQERRIFTLSNYGFYIFLLKISISFSRIAEKVNRNG
ncbi:MAG: hypothetical protein ABI851_14030 [Saprospiraceae bacterium]